MSTLKACVKNLYEDLLQQYHGTIVAMPIRASIFMFREAFRPNFVTTSEAGTMHELVALRRLLPESMALHRGCQAAATVRDD